MILNNSPMKPSGVQFASPIRPPGRQTRSISAAARSWSGANITPKVESTTSKLAVGEGQGLGIGFAEADREALGGGAGAAAFQQRRDVVGRGDLGEAARGGERGVAIAGRDVEHPFAGTDIDGLAQRLADDLQGRADHGKVAG